MSKVELNVDHLFGVSKVESNVDHLFVVSKEESNVNHLFGVSKAESNVSSIDVPHLGQLRLFQSLLVAYLFE